MDNLTLDNVSFEQELETTFDGNDFEARRRAPIRNSRRKSSKTIAAGVRRARANVRKAQTALRRLRSRIR